MTRLRLHDIPNPEASRRRGTLRAASTLTSLALSAALLLPPLAARAMAEPPGPHGGPGMHHGKRHDAMMEQHLESLGLEPEKMERVRAILASSRDARRENRREMRQAFREMRDLLDQDTPDEAAVMRQAEKMGALKTEEHKAMLQTLLKVRAELTPEQREKLKAMRPHPKERWRRGDGDDEGEPIE